MKWLTAQELKVLVAIVTLLAVGGAAKYWRAAHPAAPVNRSATP